MKVDTMTNPENKHFQLFLTAILIVSLITPIMVFSPDAEGAEPDEMVTINMYLDHDGPDDNWMNTGDSNPADETQVSDPKIWEYGWWNGNAVADPQLLTDLYIEGTLGSGQQVLVEVIISYPSLTGGPVDVTMELLDNDVPIADVTETLQSGQIPYDSHTLWRLAFNENADGDDHHTFDAGNTLKVRMTTDPEDASVNIDYDGGDAHLEFLANQIHHDKPEEYRYQEKFFLYDYWGNDKKGGEFIPNYPDHTGYDVINFEGIFVDAFTYRDIEQEGEVQLFIDAPDGRQIVINGINAQERTIDVDGEDVRFVYFSHNWSYGDEIEDEDDAGTYYVTIDILDNQNPPNYNNFTYKEALQFDISPYGVYMEFEDGTKKQEQQNGTGEFVHYNIRIWNAGLVDDDTISLATNTLSGWTAEIEPESVELDSGDDETVLMNVTIPNDALVDDSAKIDVTGESQLSKDSAYDTASDFVETTTKVSATADVKLFYRVQDSEEDGSEYVNEVSKKGTAEKGMEKDFNFRVKNDSPGNDTIDLYLNDPPDDWDAVIIDPNNDDEEVDKVELDGNDDILLEVRIRPATAQYAEDIAELEITGISRNDDTVTDRIYMNITRTLGVLVSTDADEVTKMDILKPEIPNPIDFVVENTGNDNRTFDINIDPATVPDQWQVILVSDSPVYIPKGRSEVITVEFKPPPSAIRKDEPYEIIITAKDQDNSEIRFDYDAKVNVEIIFKLEIEITEREKEIEENGGSVEYLINVKNAGNSDVDINLELEISEDKWTVKLDKYSDDFEPGALKQFTLTVTAPDPVDNKEECTVKVSASVDNHEDVTRKSVTTKTEVNKSTWVSLVDTLEEYSWVFLLVSVVVIIAVVLYYHSLEYEEEDEEDEYYEDDDYEDEDEWE